MKKQRSASPSQAIPRSAPLDLHPVDDHPPVLLQQRVRLVVGELAVRARSTSPPARAPSLLAGSGRPSARAIPLPPSTTTFIGFTFAGSMKERAWAWNSSQTSTSSMRAAAGRLAEPGFDLGLDVADPGVAGERQRALADQLHPGVGLGVVRGGDHRAAVELARADQVVEHLGRDHARRRSRSRPRRSGPRAARAAIAGAVSRMSRPSPTRSSLGCLPRSRPSTRAKARPMASAVVSSISSP